MKDSDHSDLNQETLHEQYERVKDEMDSSHVTQYGDIDNMGEILLSNFQGNKKRKTGQIGYDPGENDCSKDQVSKYDAGKISLERLMHPDSGLSRDKRAEVRSKICLDISLLPWSTMSPYIPYYPEASYLLDLSSVYIQKLKLFNLYSGQQKICSLHGGQKACGEGHERYCFWCHW